MATPLMPEFDEIWQTTTLDVSGPGIALVTQKDGSIYLFCPGCRRPGTYNKMYLYKLDIETPSPFPHRDMPVPSMSNSIIYLQHYIAAIMVFNAIIGAAPSALLAKGTGYLNTGSERARSRITDEVKSVRHGSKRLATLIARYRL